ncbi:MAG: rod shape-determining protein MreC [Spirochaetaceae bacterium]|nr:MAG: rod shape-determining protein MreC [Spirochaetaceae bacterium]
MEFVRRHKSGTAYAALTLVCTVLLSFSNSSAVIRPHELGVSLVATLQSALHAVGSSVTNTVNSVRELGELRRDYDLLLERVAHYETIEQDVHALQVEIDRLNQVLGFSENLRYRNVPARVVGKDPGNLFSTITINRGTRDGVRQKMAVVAVQEGRQGLVGRVQTAGRNSSQVVPIFDGSNFVAARFERSRHEGLVQGAGIGSNYVLMRYVDTQARNEIQYGDVVITSGMASVYPAGIPIGVIEAIQARPYETSLELLVQPMVDFSRLEHVFVVLAE